jgi:hypothetical protein
MDTLEQWLDVHSWIVESFQVQIVEQKWEFYGYTM